jgi:hypothetical protein
VVKICVGEIRKSNKESEFAQSTLYHNETPLYMLIIRGKANIIVPEQSPQFTYQVEEGF